VIAVRRAFPSLTNPPTRQFHMTQPHRKSATIRQHAEEPQSRKELSGTAKLDERSRPANWLLSPWFRFVTYLMGGTLATGLRSAPKYMATAG